MRGRRSPYIFPFISSPTLRLIRTEDSFWNKICQTKMFLWQVALATAILPAYRNNMVDHHQLSYFRPGPMQTETANLVRRGTEQP